tara:strand:+ start:1092 stop:1313 length:222 start_codon:yes stop_codon:yes gene_type:complete
MAINTPLPEKSAKTIIRGLLGAQLLGLALLGLPDLDRKWIIKTTRTSMQPVVMARLGFIELFIALHNVGGVNQ